MKRKLEEINQWIRDHHLEIITWSAAASAVVGVVYGGMQVYNNTHFTNEQLKMMRESLDHYKENHTHNGDES